MNQLVLIVVISIIAAIVVGSSVFFAWTLMEKLRSRPARRERAEVKDDEGQDEAKSTGEKGQEG
jgi:hypothetical protein